MPHFMNNKSDRWLIFRNDELLFINNTLSLEFPDIHSIQAIKSCFIRQHLLGQLSGHNVYCAEVSSNATFDNPLFEWLPLRNALEQFGEPWYNNITKAFTIITWDRNHQHCGRCGSPTAHNPDSFERYCAHCKLTFYPRISPSVIILISRGDDILMARGYHFKPGVYGLIAGFVEAGENIEDTIHREIYEETQICIKNIKYFGSQVWPFPDSLMLGFFADYDSGELNIENDEIEDAGWYHYNNLPGRPTTRLSIASKMLDHFIAQKQSNST